MENNLVQKSNVLIYASYSMTQAEQQLLMASISKFNGYDDVEACSEPVEITVSEIQDIFYTASDRQNAYRDIEAAANRIFDRELLFGDPESGQYSRQRWVKRVDFNRENKALTLWFNETLAPFLFELKANYTTYRLKYAAQLTSVYAIRIYELIASWHGQNRSFWELSLDELRAMLNITHKYKQFGELRKFVIETAVKQINDFTDFELEASFRKSGRSYKAVQFRFQRKEYAVIDEAKRKEKKKIKQEQKTKREASQATIARQEAAKNATFPPDGTFVRVNGVLGQIEGNMARIIQGEETGKIIPYPFIVQAIQAGKLEVVNGDDKELAPLLDNKGNLDLWGF